MLVSACARCEAPQSFGLEILFNILTKPIEGLRKTLLKLGNFIYKHLSGYQL
jgi:hypothetical protein